MDWEQIKKGQQISVLQGFTVGQLKFTLPNKFQKCFKVECYFLQYHRFLNKNTIYFSPGTAKCSSTEIQRPFIIIGPRLQFTIYKKENEFRNVSK